MKKRDFFLDFLTLSRYRILRHSIAVPFFLICLQTAHRRNEFSGHVDVYLSLASFFVIIGLFYLNMYVLLPRLFYRRHYLPYFLALITAIFLGIELIEQVIYSLEKYRIVAREKPLGTFQHYILILGFMFPFFLASSSLKLFQQWLNDAKKISELEHRALESEIKALRDQVNPHFLFNMLNNINVLTHRDPRKASEIIMKLADYLRYNLYETNEDQVSLLKEIKFFTNFLNLENIRRDDFSFDIFFDEDALAGIKIPPHIFIIFVENAAKYSADTMRASRIEVYFKKENEYIHFKCINTMPELKIVPNDAGGLGQINVRRRLELVYQNRYTLEYSKNEKHYIVDLTLPI